MNPLQRIKLTPDDGAGGGDTIKYIKMTDPETGQDISVPESMETFVGHLVSFNRKAGRKNLLQEKEELNLKIETLEDEIEGMKKTKSKKNDSVINEEYQKKFKELQESVNTATKTEQEWRTKYESTKISNDIQNALSGYELNDRSSVVDLLRMRGNARMVEKIDLTTGQKTGEFNTVLTLDIADEKGNVTTKNLEPKDAAEQFLKMESNSYLIKNQLKPGGGSHTGGAGNGSKSMSRSNFDNLPPDQRVETIRAGTTITE